MHDKLLVKVDEGRNWAALRDCAIWCFDSIVTIKTIYVYVVED